MIQGGNSPITLQLSETPYKPMQQALAQLKQGELILEWQLSDMIINEDLILLPVTQEDTYSFNEGTAYLEFKYYIDGNVWLANKKPIYVYNRDNKYIFQPSIKGDIVNEIVTLDILTDTVYVGESISGVDSVNNLKGNVVITNGENIDVSTVNNEIVISSQMYHNNTFGRDVENSHPMSAITGLETEISTIENDLLNKDLEISSLENRVSANESEIDNIGGNIETIDDDILDINNNKADKISLNNLFKSVSYNPSTNIMSFTTYNNTIVEVTNLPTLRKADNVTITLTGDTFSVNTSIISKIDINTEDIEALQLSLSNKANISQLPTKISELIQDIAYITNSTSDLINYYTKSQTMSKEEIQQLFSTATSLEWLVVTELPPISEGKTGVIYLIAVGEPSDPDYYKEYFFHDGRYDPFGTTSVNLSDYVTKVTFDSSVANLQLQIDSKTTKTYVDENISALTTSIATKADKTSTEASISTLNTTKADKTTTEQSINTLNLNKADKVETNEAINNLQNTKIDTVTAEAEFDRLDASIGTKADKTTTEASISTLNNNKADKTAIPTTVKIETTEVAFVNNVATLPTQLLEITLSDGSTKSWRLVGVDNG